jgi:cytochrome c5
VILRNTLAILSLLTLAAPAAFAADGAQVFTDLKCSGCHSVPAAGITAKLKSAPGGVLPPEGVKRDAAWYTGFLEHKIELDGKKHKKAFKGSDEELKTLVDWLMQLQGS